MDMQERILRIRSNAYSALKQDTADVLDVTVPPASIGRLLDRVDDIAKEHGINLPAYGHVGDGNLHVHIMKGDDSKKDLVETIRTEVYQASVALGGVITGEHGIGRTRLACVSKYVGEDEILIMRKIKEVFDPENILNPGVKIPR
jgi:glycolate oxidase